VLLVLGDFWIFVIDDYESFFIYVILSGLVW